MNRSRFGFSPKGEGVVEAKEVVVVENGALSFPHQQ
jgi:hypothetical protein